MIGLSGNSVVPKTCKMIRCSVSFSALPSDLHSETHLVDHVPIIAVQDVSPLLVLSTQSLPQLSADGRMHWPCIFPDRQFHFPLLSLFQQLLDVREFLQWRLLGCGLDRDKKIISPFSIYISKITTFFCLFGISPTGFSYSFSQNHNLCTFLLCAN